MGLFRVFHNVKHAFKTAGSTIIKGGKEVVKPAFVATNTVAGAVYDHVLKPVAHDAKKATQFVVDEGSKFAKKGEQFLSAEADVLVNTEQSMATAIGGLGKFSTEVEEGLGGLLKNSWSYVLIGGAIIGAYVILKR